MATIDLVTHRSTPNKAALIFVHGFTGSAETTWASFASCILAEPTLRRWDLFSAGYSTNLRVDFAGIWSADPDLADVARVLHATLTIDPLAKYKALAIAAHSMGGLAVQRTLLDRASICARTSHVFLYGTPSAGLTKARFGWRLKRQLRDMSKKGGFIKTLRSDWNKKFGVTPPFRLTVVRGENDEFVPFASSHAPFDPSTHEAIAGNHVEIVRAKDGNHPGVRLLIKRLNNNTTGLGPWDSARLAVEAGDFNGAIELLWPHRDKIDDAAVVQLAIALDKRGRAEDAIELLTERKGSNTDAMGTLAGRLKRRWLRGRLKADAERALELYTGAYQRSKGTNSHQAYYHAINIAFMELAYRRDYAAMKEWARLALKYCAAASNQAGDDRVWRAATEGEANLLLGKTDMAFSRYRDAIAAQPDPWQLESMFLQALEVARQFNDKALAERLGKTFEAQL
jgi:pimeloyl-ACP methyl ester carboxylesterase